MASKSDMIASFIAAAPPGELSDVVNDIKTLTKSQPSLLSSQDAAFRKYNESQFTTVTLPGASQQVLVTPFNALGEDRYFDPDTQTSFAFDHETRKASAAQSHVLDSPHADLVKSLAKSLSTYATEHFPTYTVGVYPHDAGVKIALVSSKYSPSNFWNGRWRSEYSYSPGVGSLEGSIKVDVHYYEDGNVRMLTDKSLSLSASAQSSAQDLTRLIGLAEKKYQEELNRAFTSLSEGAFKSLRRQLPVTRQKIEWEKIGGYRLGQEIGGGRSR